MSCVFIMAERSLTAEDFLGVLPPVLPPFGDELPQSWQGINWRAETEEFKKQKEQKQQDVPVTETKAKSNPSMSTSLHPSLHPKQRLLKPLPIKLAVVGSRNFDKPHVLTEVLNQFVQDKGTPSVIVSGGATGADTFAEIYAAEKKIPIKVFKPDWKQYGKSAGPKRNLQIVHESNFMIAFRTSKDSAGTNISIALAQGKKIPIWIVDIKGSIYELTKL